MKTRKKILFAAFFIILITLFLFPEQTNFSYNTNIQFYNFNNKFKESNKLKFLSITSNFIGENSIYKFNYIKKSFKKIINKDISVPEFNPDYFIIFTFINSLYYLVKFKINLWAHNKSILTKKNNNITPYFNININNKIINIGLDINF
jgi:hypothetical protein